MSVERVLSNMTVVGEVDIGYFSPKNWTFWRILSKKGVVKRGVSSTFLKLGGKNEKSYLTYYFFILYPKMGQSVLLRSSRKKCERGGLFSPLYSLFYFIFYLLYCYYTNILNSRRSRGRVILNVFPFANDKK